jgi:acyl-CoA thioester hydrolase
MTDRRVLPFPEDIQANLAVLKSAHARLARPAALGRVIGIPGRSETHEQLLASGTRH